MCTFIFVVLPEEVNLELVQPVFVSAGKLLRPTQSEEFHNVPGRVFYTTRGHCDCRTLVGRSHYPDRVDNGDPDKLRRKGWSAAKIARWQGERKRAHIRRDEKRNAPGEEDLTRWLRLFPALLDSGVTPWVGLFHYWCTNERQVTVTANVRVDWARVDADFLMRMEEGVCYTGATKRGVHREEW